MDVSYINIYLYFKNLPLILLLFNHPFLLAGTGIKYLFFKKMGYGADYAEGFCEGIKTLGTCKKVAFRTEHIGNYLQIEWELFTGTLLYVWEFLKRRLKK